MDRPANSQPDNMVDAPDGSEGGVTNFKKEMERFEVMRSFWNPIHSEAIEDDKFLSGDQWPDIVKQERIDAGRPMMTFNKLPAFCRQITNKMRQERPQLKVTPVQTNKRGNPTVSNVQGSKDYSLADVFSGIIRNIEHVSRADQAYDTAAKHAVDHSFGFFYLINQWSESDPFSQELVIKRVKNSYNVLLGPEAENADYSDMPDAFMHTNMTRQAFEAKYPGKQVTEFHSQQQGTNYEGWFDSDSVRVAQYFWIEHKDDEILMLTNGVINYKSILEPVLDELKQQYSIVVATTQNGQEMRKPCKRKVCMWQKMTAVEILEGPLELPFSAVPIFPVFGDELIVDGRTIYESAIRHARDPQTSYNYMKTNFAEGLALQPRAPFIGTEKNFKGHERDWDRANTDNVPYLTYTPDERNGNQAPQRQYPGNSGLADMQLASSDSQDIQDIIGIHEASLGADGNEKSGRAIQARQQQGLTSTFQFPDNLARAQQQCGRLMVEAIPRIYDSQRIVRIRMPDGNDDFVELNSTIVDEETGKEILVHDLGVGKYDVTLDTGPSYQTQRQEAADLQMELLKVLGPEQAANIVHLIVENLGVPGSDEVARVLRKMLPDVLKSEEEKLADLPKGVTQNENGELVNQDGTPYEPPPTIEQQQMAKAQEIEELKHTAELKKHEATIAKAAADQEEAKAELAQVQAQLQQAEAEMQQLTDQANQQGDQIVADIRQAIEDAMAQHEANPKAHADAIADGVVEAIKRSEAVLQRALGQQQPAEQEAAA